MGVIACDKKGCDHIMCDTTVGGSYHICDDCKEQFKDWLRTQYPLYLEDRQFVYDKFVEFMSIGKPEYSDNPDIDNVVNDFFNEDL